MTPWWAPLIAAAVTSIGALAVGGMALYGALKSNARTIESAATLAHTQWKRQRRTDAYIELLTAVERGGQWVSIRGAVVQIGPPPEKLRLPDMDEQARYRALLVAHGSPEVQSLYEKWRQALADFLNEHATLNEVTSGQIQPVDVGMPMRELRRRVHQELREAERKLRDQIGEQVARELDT